MNIFNRKKEIEHRYIEPKYIKKDYYTICLTLKGNKMMLFTSDYSKAEQLVTNFILPHIAQSKPFSLEYGESRGYGDSLDFKDIKEFKNKVIFPSPREIIAVELYKITKEEKKVEDNE